MKISEEDNTFVYEAVNRIATKIFNVCRSHLL